VHDLHDELRHHHTWELLDRYTTTDRIPELGERLVSWKFGAL
jgi:hypothetical protein